MNDIGLPPAMADIGLPPELHGPAVWYGPEVAARSDGLEHFSAAEVAELEAAALALAAIGPEPAAPGQASFPLPLLAPRLARVRAELLRGRGFVLLRGLPVQRWPQRVSELAFIGLGTHLCTALSQNAQGDLLGHVRDLGMRSSDPRVRIRCSPSATAAWWRARAAAWRPRSSSTERCLYWPARRERRGGQALEWVGPPWRGASD